MMEQREASFVGTHDANIYYQYWLPEAAPVAVILVCHGAAEHGGRYERFAAEFTARGYVVAALDQFGHGKSDGGRCCLRHLDDHVRNLETFRGLMADAFEGLPLVLLGHSMGGLVACTYLLAHQHRFAACVLSGPAVKTELTPSWYQIALIRLQSLLFPDRGAMQLDASGVSRLPQEVERYVNDPLNYMGPLSARMVAELFRGMAVVQKRAGEIRLPLLLLHGGADRMTAPAGSELLYRQVSSQDKELHIYPGAYHEIFNEPERDEVFGDIEKWLAGQLS